MKKYSSQHQLDGIHHYLLLLARQSDIADVRRCERSFGQLKVNRHLRVALQRKLKTFDLNQPRFCVLVALYSRDPLPMTLADLAFHTARKRASLRKVLRSMAPKAWVQWSSDGEHAQKSDALALTDEGRHVAAFAMYRYLQTASELCPELPNLLNNHSLVRATIHHRAPSLTQIL